MLGKNAQTFCTHSGIVAKGIYAPIRKPITVEKTVLTLAIVPSREIKEQISTVKSTESVEENNMVARIVKKSTKVNKNSPIHAIYTKHTSKKIQQIMTVTIKLNKK